MADPEKTTPVPVGPGQSPAVERLRARTTCPKCGGPYRQPKLLPCNHSVCRVCLHLQPGVRKGLVYMVACPACGTETELPKSGLQALPEAYFKGHLSEAFSRLEKAEEGQGCEECGKPDVSLAAFCGECRRFMCCDCHAMHKRLKSLSGHPLFPLDEFRRSLRKEPSPASLGRSSSLPLSPANPMLCASHNEPLKLYCRTCSCLICSGCTVRDHATPRHKHEFVSKLVKGDRATLSKGMAAVRDIRGELGTAGDGMADVQQSLAEQKTSLTSLINNSFTDLHNRLEVTRKSLLRVAEKKAADKVSALSGEMATLEGKVRELDGLIGVCEEALHHTSEQEFMALRRDLQARVKEATMKRQDYLANLSGIQPPDLLLPGSLSGEILAVCAEHSHSSLGASCTHSMVTQTTAGPVEVGKRVVFTVAVLTHTGLPCIERVEVGVDVLVPRTHLVVPFQVTPGLQLGTYIISFKPSVKGEHVISLRLGEKEMATSPVRIVVRSPDLELDGPQLVLTQQEWPWGVACSTEREVYVTENFNHRVSVWDRDGNHLRNFGQKGQKPGQLLSPTGVIVDQSCHIYVADGKENGRVQKFSSTGQLLAVYVGLKDPHGVALNPNQDRLYVCDNSNQQIVVLDSDLHLVETFGEMTCSLERQSNEVDGVLESPHSLAVDSTGNVYVSDTSSRCIHVFNGQGLHLRSIKYPHDDTFAPTGVAIEGERVFAADVGGSQVVVFSTTGELVTATGSYGKAAGQFHNPTGVAVDCDGYLYVCDYGNSRVQVY